MGFNVDVLDKILNPKTKDDKVNKSNKKRRRKNQNDGILKTKLTKPHNKTDNKEKDLIKKKLDIKKTQENDASLFINEKLSTCTSKEAYEFFLEDPAAFEVYHKGFSNQRVRWPEDPLDWVMQRIRTLPSPKSLILADFGCGDGRLGKKLKGKLCKIHNYDLVSTSEDVVACDISNVPLEPNSVDVVVISLALMGTNSQEYIAEANRILRQDGSLILVELVSRMITVKGFVDRIRKYGFKRLDATNKDFNTMEKNYFVRLHMIKTNDCGPREKLPDLDLKAVMCKKR